MGTGTDVAMESAGITLVKGDLNGIVKAIHLSRAVMRNIRQNLFFAFFYNALGIPIAAGLLYPFFGILLSPIIAGAAMSLSSVSVIANALRLQRVRLTRSRSALMTLFFLLRLFLARRGFIDSVVGGGGLIQIPAMLLLLPGLPVATILGTNKFASCAGTTIAVQRYARHVAFDWATILPAALAAFIFSFLGSRTVALLNTDQSCVRSSWSC